MRRKLAAVVVVWLAKLASADTRFDPGCRPGDPAFDNGAVLTSLIRSGEVREPIRIAGGIYYHTTTIDDCLKEGLRIEGNGMASWANAAAFQPHGRGTSPVIFVYVGPPDQPAWRFRSFGTSVRGINIWRGFKPVPAWQVDWQGTGIEFARNNPGPPAGKWDFSHLCIAGFDIGMHFAASDNNVDNSTFTHIRFESCRTSAKCTNPQTTVLDWRHVTVNGAGETVFDTVGGNWLIQSLGLVEPRLILRTGQLSSNACSFEFYGTKIDNNAAGWRLVEMAKLWPAVAHRARANR